MACYIPFGPHTPWAQLFCNNSAWQPPSVIQVHHPNPNRSLESRHKCGSGDPDPPGAGTLVLWRQPQQPIQHSAWGLLKRSTERWSFHFINQQNPKSERVSGLHHTLQIWDTTVSHQKHKSLFNNSVGEKNNSLLSTTWDQL